MIPGTKIQMGGNDFLVPPLTLGQLRRLQPKIKLIGSLSGADVGDDQVDAIGEIVSAALSRNYPDMTPERVLDLLDLGNARDVISAVLGASGLKPGEAEAVTKTNGATSMGSSPPPADTVIQ